jgi:hypothetical protein
MADLTPFHINSYTRYAGGLNARAWNFTNVGASTVWYAADQIAYLPFSLPWSYTAKRVFWANGATVAGNVDMGIYSLAGAKLTSTGLTAQAGVSVLQYASLPVPYVLAAGSYLWGITLTNGTATIILNTTLTAVLGRFSGLYQQANGAGAALPATATFAAWNSVGYPFIGMTRTASGF